MGSQQEQKKIKVGIVGGTGYTGVELLRLLSTHPNVQLQAITSRKEDGLHVAQMFPNLRGHIDLKFTTPEQAQLNTCDVVFFATPHGVAMSQAQELLNAGVKIIDLAADFRLQDTQVFEQWYKQPHACPEILKDSVYGLCELNREAIKKAQVIGNPGCYPTTVTLGLAPVLQQGLIDPSHIVADCKSGTSGAGRGANVANLYAEAGDNFKAYGVGGHRHHPEIVEQLNKLSAQPVGLTFVPHLVPMIRGMFSTLYVKIKETAHNTDFQQVYEQFYKDEPFIDIMPAGSVPETRMVKASNHLKIAIQRQHNSEHLIILVIQDNLVKGASGQAVQNMNLMFNLPENTGLGHIAVLP